MRGEVRKGRMRGERGVALIIVLLVTALLLALIFEFAYGTRISLRAAVNFRDSERAYFLARSGVHLFGKFKDRAELEGVLPPQGEWGVVPVVSTGDTELRIRWEDEGGKLDIRTVGTGVAYNRLVKLFEDRSVNPDYLDQIKTWLTNEQRTSLFLLTELHRFLNDEDFLKLQDALTVAPVGGLININTASVDVLRSTGMDALKADDIVDHRAEHPFKTIEDIKAKIPDLGISTQLTYAASTVFKVDSFATVGGYTKQVEAVITKAGAATTINYWRAL